MQNYKICTTDLQTDEKKLQLYEKRLYLCSLKATNLRRVSLFLRYCTDFQFQIPERLPQISKTLTDNQAVRVFSYPKHPLPCQPRVNRFRDMFFLMAQITSHKVPSLTRLTPSVDTTKNKVSPTLPLTNTHQEHPHKPPSHPLSLTNHT